MNLVEPEDFPELQRARKLWSSKHLAQAFEAFDQAIEARPNHAVAHIEFAEAIGSCFQVEFAEELLETAEGLAASDPNALVRVAQAYSNIYRPRKTIVLLDRLRAAERLTPFHLGRLAAAYEKCNDLSSARVTIEQCIRLVPDDQQEPRLIQARLLRQMGEYQKARSILDPLVKQPSSDLLAIQAWVQLGHVHDHGGDFAAAVEAMSHAKNLQKRSPEFEQLRSRNHAIYRALHAIYDSWDQMTINAWRQSSVDESSDRVGNPKGIAFLIGFPRSGSTLLEQVLGAHPSIANSPERAVFTQQILPAICRGGLTIQALNDLSAAHSLQLRQLYVDCHQSILGESVTDKVLIDKNPNLTSLLGPMLRLAPDANFIFAVRDPRDVIVSCYMQGFPLTEFSSAFLTWEDTVDQYLRDIRIWQQSKDLLSHCAVEVRYEDLVHDLKSGVREVLSLLNLDWDDSMRNYLIRTKSKIVNSPSRADVNQPIHHRSIGRWKNYRQWLEPHLEPLFPVLDFFGYA